MTDILTVEQVAEMLGCTPETVREKTPAMVWSSSLSDSGRVTACS